MRQCRLDSFMWSSQAASHTKYTHLRRQQVVQVAAFVPGYDLRTVPQIIGGRCIAKVKGIPQNMKLEPAAPSAGGGRCAV